MPGVADSTEEQLLATVRSADEWLQHIADTVPVPVWGFDDDVHKLISDRKHELMNDKLSGWLTPLVQMGMTVYIVM